jgi:3',5'-cyclic AMP phosphodiesterase CpdA
MQRSGKLTVIFIILSLISRPGYCQQREISSPFFFIQLTDPQFGFFEANNGFGKETELYEKAVHEINRLNPDFVVITGDLVNNKDDRGQVAEFKRITAEINSGIPVYYSPGNHDIGESPTQQDIDLFISDYGHEKFSFRYKNNLFIGLNSCLIKANTPMLEQIQFDWLKKELTKGKGVNHIIIFSHYPFFLNKYDEPETYSNISIDTRYRYLSLFNENNVDAVFAGHLHNNSLSEYGTLEMITTSAIGKPLAKVPSGMRIIKVYPDRIESEYYSLDEIPAEISFE